MVYIMFRTRVIGHIIMFWICFPILRERDCMWGIHWVI